MERVRSPKASEAFKVLADGGLLRHDEVSSGAGSGFSKADLDAVRLDVSRRQDASLQLALDLLIKLKVLIVVERVGGHFARRSVKCQSLKDGFSLAW